MGSKSYGRLVATSRSLAQAPVFVDVSAGTAVPLYTPGSAFTPNARMLKANEALVITSITMGAFAGNVTVNIVDRNPALPGVTPLAILPVGQTNAVLEGEWMGAPGEIPYISVLPATVGLALQVEMQQRPLNGENYDYAVSGEINFVAAEPAGPAVGDTYRNTTSGNTSITAQAVLAGDFLRWNGANWTQLPKPGTWLLRYSGANALPQVGQVIAIGALVGTIEKVFSPHSTAVSGMVSLKMDQTLTLTDGLAGAATLNAVAWAGSATVERQILRTL